MTGSLNRSTQLVGRLLMSAIFLVTGFVKVTHWSATAGVMAAKGVPLPSISLPIAILLELGGGLLLVLGYRTRLVASLLTLYLIPVTLTFHNFWAYHGVEQQAQMVNFLKNLAILGGLVRMASDGAGGLSLDAGRTLKRVSRQLS